MNADQAGTQPEGPLTAHRLESLGRLTRGAAHEFNNLLGVVLGYVELARMGMDADPERARGYLDHALQTLSRSAGLSEQLLTLSQSGESAPPHAQPGPVVDAAHLLLNACGGRTLQFQFVADPNAPVVALERGGLLQLFVGLGTLAIRAATPEVETMKLHLRADDETGSVRVDIEGLDLSQERERPEHRANVEALEALIQRAGGTLRAAPAGQTQIDLPPSRGGGAPVFPSE